MNLWRAPRVHETVLFSQKYDGSKSFKCIPERLKHDYQLPLKGATCRAPSDFGGRLFSLSRTVSWILAATRKNAPESTESTKKCKTALVSGLFFRPVAASAHEHTINIWTQMGCEIICIYGKNHRKRAPKGDQEIADTSAVLCQTPSMNVCTIESPRSTEILVFPRVFACFPSAESVRSQ